MKNLKLPNLIQKITPLILITGASCGVIFLQNRNIQQVELQLNETQYLFQDKQEQQSLNMLGKLPSFGFDNLMGDWFYLKFIQYFGDRAVRDKMGYVLCPIYFKTIVARDSRFTDAVNSLDVCTSIFAGEPLLSIKYLEASLKEMQPKMFGVRLRPYYTWRSLGIGQLLFLGKPLETAKSYQTAIDWARNYHDENSQRFVANTQQSVDYLKKNPNSIKAQIGAWANVLGNSPDEKTLKRVIKEVNAIGGRVEIGSNGSIRVKLPENIN